MTLRDPVRLTELGVRGNPELAAAVRGLRERHGSAEQARALEARVAESFRAGTPPEAPRAAARFTWLNRYSLFLAAATAGVIALVVPAPVAKVPPRRVSHDARETTVERPTAVRDAIANRAEPTPSARIELAPQAASARPVAQAKARAARGERAARAVPATQASESELELLARARALVRRDPEAALVLVARHAREDPHGLFVQEREVLAVDALLRSHTAAARREARARAERFVASYPESAHAVRLRRMLADWAGAAAGSAP